MLLEKILVSLLSTLTIIPLEAPLLSKSDSVFPEPQGTETLYLQGLFSGIETNRQTEERKFFFNEETLMYELYIDLKQGDYFYPYDKFKQMPFYWSIDEMGRDENVFTANGLSWYSRTNDDGFWYVNVDGKYHFSITYLIENYLNNSRIVWREEYGSTIEYMKEDNEQIYYLLEKDDDSYSAFTEKDGSRIHEYGYGVGKPIQNTKNLTIFGDETKTIVCLPYNSLFSEYHVLSKVDKNNNVVDKTDNTKLENNAIFLDLSGSRGDESTRKICSVLSKIEFGIKTEIVGDSSYPYSLNTLEQIDAKQIIDEFDKLNDDEKQKILESSFSYSDGDHVFHENSKINEIIGVIRKRSKKVFKTSVWTILIPVLGVIGIISILALFLSFKRKLT